MKDLTVIFDMDGVILDSERVYQEIERSMYRELGISVSRKEHLRFMGTAERFMWTRICERYPVGRAVDELVSEERRRFLEHLTGPGIPLNEGLLPLLRALQTEHIPCWIASSSSSGIISTVLEVHRLNPYFRGFVSGEDVPRSKPSPDIFLKTAECAGVDPSHCLVIEDSDNGIQAARNAGMSVVALQNQALSLSRLAEANYIIKSLHQINPEVLRQSLE